MAFTTGEDLQTPMSEINVTPFVDVMLVLLVIFMVTAPMIQQEVDLELPETRSTKAVAVQEQDIVLTINRKKEIYIAKTKLSLKTLTPKLREIFREKRKKELYLRADKRIPYGFVVKVMALVKNAGIERMGLITDAES